MPELLYRRNKLHIRETCRKKEKLRENVFKILLVISYTNIPKYFSGTMLFQNLTCCFQSKYYTSLPVVDNLSRANIYFGILGGCKGFTVLLYTRGLEQLSLSSDHFGQSQQTQIIRWTNQNWEQFHVAGAKRGKTRARRVMIVFYFTCDWLKKLRAIF